MLNIEKAREEMTQQEWGFLTQGLEWVRDDARAMVDPFIKSGNAPRLVSALALIILALDEYPFNHPDVRVEAERLRTLKK